MSAREVCLSRLPLFASGAAAIFCTIAGDWLRAPSSDLADGYSLQENETWRDEMLRHCLNHTERAVETDTQGGMREVESPACSASSEASLTNLSLWWTIGPGEKAHALVEEQARAMELSGLLRELDSVNFWARDHVKFTLGSAEYSPDNLTRQAWFRRFFGHHADLLKKLRPAHLNASEVRWWLARDKTYEFPALEAMHRHCETVGNPRQHAIVYIHTKGSSYGGGHTWRWVMQHFAIWHYKDCVRRLACGHDTCGVKFHGALYPGNFWWARCDYVRRIGTPKPSLEDLLNTTSPSKGRFHAEGWLLEGAVRADRTSYHKSCWGKPWIGGSLEMELECFQLLPPATQGC